MERYDAFLGPSPFFFLIIVMNEEEEQGYMFYELLIQR